MSILSLKQSGNLRHGLPAVTRIARQVKSISEFNIEVLAVSSGIGMVTLRALMDFAWAMHLLYVAGGHPNARDVNENEVQ